MELKGTPEDIINSLIRELLSHGVDNGMPMELIQQALDSAGFICSLEEVIEFTDLLKEHRATCPDCKGHYNADGTEICDDEGNPIAGSIH